ncbi:hypothetical protein HU200_058934 [Digitaria exilis]|uniref:BZIP domain-containing protein n=1 Tax=Digitaria exilis TaxID=1010633 RepID=A0A835E3A3_9POAL|nr:hypothetical protein HU200_058934 [Digitaria exilis]
MLARHPLSSPEFASFYSLLHHGVHEPSYSGGGEGLWRISYSCHGGVSGAGELEQQDAGGAAAARGDDDERRARRQASNRESARRARARRRGQLDELSSRVAELRAANAQLAVRLNHVAAARARLARESARLREEARDLRERLDAAEAKAAAKGKEEVAGDEEAGTPTD